MEKIQYQIEIRGVNEKQQEVKLQIYASSASQLLKKLKDVLEEKSKFSILKVIGWK